MDSDSDIDDDAAPSSSPSDSLQGAHLADPISQPAHVSSNESLPQITLLDTSQLATLPNASSPQQPSIFQPVPLAEPPLVVQP